MRRLLRRTLTLGLIIGLPLAIVYGLTVVYVAAHRGGMPDAVPADCGIVFGTAVWPVYNKNGDIIDSVAGPGITRRVETAVDLYQQGRLHRLFMTGGKGEENQKSEAQVMRDLAVTMHVPSERITVEDRARSTWENILFTRPLTEGCMSVVGISDGYHLARISIIASMQGWELPTYATAVKPHWLFILRNLLREAVGVDLLVAARLLT